MSTAAILILLGLVPGIVIGAWLILRINQRITWYVPAYSNARLSKELTTNLAVVQAYSAQLESLLANVDEKVQEFVKVVDDVSFSRELVSDVLQRSATGQFQNIQSEVIARISRDVSQVLASRLLTSQSSTLNFGSEYVLLHELEDFSFEINLTPKFFTPRELKSAILRALEYQPRKQPKVVDDRSRAEWFLEAARDYKDFELFLGKLGEELFNLRWEGTVALRRGAA